MKNRVSIVLIACLVVGACTTTRQVRRPATIGDFEAALPNQRDRVTLLWQPSAEPPEPRLTFAPVDHPPPREEPLRVTDVAQLRGYEVLDRGRGALEGLGLGIAFGALAGFAVGASNGSDGPCTNDDGGCVMFSASEKGLAIGLIGALVGSVVGPIVGFAVGHTKQYLFTR